MKKIIKLINFTLMLTIALISCSHLGNENGLKTDTDLINHVDFEAIVLEVNEAFILVEPVASQEERQSSDKINVKRIDETEFQKGDRINIKYDGAILESYPAQLHEIYAIDVIE